MEAFTYRNGRLFCENKSVETLAARYGTPLYVYSRRAFLAHLDEIKRAFRPASPLICYSVKANSNLSILRLLARAGAGFDIVSGGELFRALKSGARASSIVFAGVGKSPPEIAVALKAGIFMFNAESEAELDAANHVAGKLALTARVALRLNPDVDARTHAKTTTAKKENKFGIDLQTARDIFARRERYPHIDICGIHLHLGSPIYSLAPFRSAMRKLKGFLGNVRNLGARVTTLNIGGGYAISYDGKPTLRPADYAQVVLPAVKAMNVKLCLEPGRFIAGNAGILLSRVIYRKDGWLGRKFIILDAAMNDLLRPALYGSYHHIWPVSGPPSPLFGPTGQRGGRRPHDLETVDIVGPVCESSDCFAANRKISPLQKGDLVAIYSAGAYGMAMSSTYNSRPRPCEVLVSGKRARVIRRRETYDDLIRGE
ncbi:MAG: diaminopimelate decarboxylase [Alphaproteobacteria bacterium]